MKKTVNQYEFVQAFRDHERHLAWTREGLCALFDYLEDLDPDLELDVVALDCEWTEYASARECVDDWGRGVEIDDSDPAEAEARCREYLEAETIVLPVGDAGRVVVCNF